MSQQINGNDLIALGYPQNEILGLALKANKKRTGLTKAEMLNHYALVLNNPETYLDNKIFGRLAQALIEGVQNNIDNQDFIALNDQHNDYEIFGIEQIEEGALQQMNIAMKLQITVAGAIMPDAHQGYGLPIGGVLATKNAVIPYGVGVDIGCRMALSIFNISTDYFSTNADFYKKIIFENTAFGAGNGFRGQYRSDHEVLNNSLFQEHPFIKQLKDKAWSQLGSSGGGNHFVEFGTINFEKDDATLNIPEGKYLALLTHSGSRGLGATIAGHYTRLAKNLCKLPQEAKNLAYLDLNTEAGQEYWLAMNLAGDYASACHEIIHKKIAIALSEKPMTIIENHHNFAWKEILNGEEVIVHRKGATPAGKDILGIIPGSMATPGFLVRGKGNISSINSASHGAGRQMSRTQANKNIDIEAWHQSLKDAGVTLLGAGKDEAPMAYKDIHTVMAAQQDLVDVVATFQPKMVRMVDDGSKED